MVFSSGVFLFLFLPIVLAVYYICPGKLRNTVLFVFSLIFYAWGEPIYVGIMIFSTAFDYCNGMLIETFRKKHNEKICKIVIIMSVVVNLGILAFFKYTDFVITNINNLFGASVSLLQIALPIGISFYTFQTLSYTIDVYLGKVKVQHNIINFGMYVSMFPQLIAGPIVRYSDVENQIARRNENIDDIANGFRRFIVGLSKKILVANQVGNLWDEISAMSSITTSMAWVGAIAYTFQIYFDFSGYSDMAIGLGQMFGFHFLENFNYPFISRSITELWRRWHISLGSWFRDYVYIPLGGSRVAAKRRLYFIWHGAKWTYIVWGMMYFVLLCVERILNLSGQKSWLGWIYTVFFFIAGNVVFRSENVTGALKYLLAMFNIHTTGLLDEKAVYYFAEYKMFLLIGMAAALPIAVWLRAQAGRCGAWIERLRPVWCAAVFLVALSFIVKGGYNPFIYFDF